MADKIDILIQSRLDAKGFAETNRQAAALKKTLADVAAALKGATGGGGGTAGAQAAKAQADALKLQAQAAKTATAEQQALTAGTRQAAAQATAQAAALRATAAQYAAQAGAARAATAEIAKQAAAYRLQAQEQKSATAASVPKTKDGLAILPRSFAGFSGEAANTVDMLTKIGVAAGGVTAAIAVTKAAFDFGAQGASLETARQSFDHLAASAGTSGAALLASMKDASAGTVAESQIIQSSNTALLLIGSQVATKLPQLLSIAKASAQTLGTDVGQVFDSLVTGIARGSTELIDNAGITISASEAYASYAASVGKSADELSKSEKSQAVLNGVLEKGGDIIARSGGGADNAATGFAKFSAAGTDLKDSLATLTGDVLSPVADALGNITAAAADATKGLAEVGKQNADKGNSILDAAKGYADYTNQIAEANQNQITAIAPLSEAQYTYAQSLIATGTNATQAAAMSRQYVDILGEISIAQQVAAAGSQEQGAAMAALAPQIMAVATSGEYGKTGVMNLLTAVEQGSMTTPQFAAALTALQTQITNASAAAANDAAIQSYRTGEIMAGQSATAGLTTLTLTGADVMYQDAAAKQESEFRTASLNAAQTTLASLGGSVASGLMTAASAASALAAQYGYTYSQAVALISAQARLAGMSGVGMSGAAGVTEARSERSTRADLAQIGSDKAMKAMQTRMAKLNAPPKKPRGGGGGGAPKLSPQAAAGGKLADIQESTDVKLQKIAREAGEKLLKIDEDTQQKLAAIDQKAAEHRAQIAQQLSDDIASSNASMNSDFEADDLDQFGKDITDDQKKQFKIREAAEVNYRKRVSDAQQQAVE